MLYFFYGDDILKIKSRVRAITDSLLNRKPDASLFSLSTDNWSRSGFEELLRGQTMFEQNYIVVCDRLSLLSADDWKLVIDSISLISDSPHVFIFIEDDLKKKEKDLLLKRSTRSEVDDAKTTLGAKPFDIFSLTEALSRKDKGRLWKLLHQAFQSGKAPEEIFGIFLWQLRVIDMAIRHDSPQGAGLKPFVYQKAQKVKGSFSLESLSDLRSDLVSCYHRSRKGVGGTMAEELERFVLSI